MLKLSTKFGLAPELFDSDHVIYDPKPLTADSPRKFTKI
jgi:hypothetical protein